LLVSLHTLWIKKVAPRLNFMRYFLLWWTCVIENYLNYCPNIFLRLSKYLYKLLLWINISLKCYKILRLQEHFTIKSTRSETNMTPILADACGYKLKTDWKFQGNRLNLSENIEKKTFGRGTFLTRAVHQLLSKVLHSMLPQCCVEQSAISSERQYPVTEHFERRNESLSSRTAKSTNRRRCVVSAIQWHCLQIFWLMA